MLELVLTLMLLLMLMSPLAKLRDLSADSMAVPVLIESITTSNSIPEKDNMRI
jgi:hypothetical protein